MATKQDRKASVADIAKQVASAMQKGIDAEVEVTDNGKLRETNSKGEMLLCEVTMPRGNNMPDPQVVTINEEIRWVRRGVKTIVPWYFVEHLLLNIERKYRQEIDVATGKNVVTFDDIPALSFTWLPVDPNPSGYKIGPQAAE